MQCVYIQTTPRRTTAHLIIIVQPKLEIRAMRQWIIQMQTCLAIHLRIMFLDAQSLTKPDNRQVERSSINAKCVRGISIESGTSSVTCIHRVVKNHQCKVCDKRFAQSQHLKYHMRVHTGEKPYQCKICDTGFAMSHHLKRHMSIHTGNQPY